MSGKGIVLLESGPGRDITRRHCRQAKIPIGVLEALVEAELDQVGKLRKRGLHDRFDDILGGMLEEEDEAAERGEVA